MSEKPLLKGEDIINQFQLSPSPLFGRILNDIQKAQVLGIITTPEDAVTLAGDIIQSQTKESNRMTTRYSTTQWNNKKVILGEPEIDTEKPVNLLIGFHGAGSTPENMLVQGNRLKLPNTLMFFPEGQVYAGEGVWSWWEDGPRQSETVKSFITHTSQFIDFCPRALFK